MEAVKKGTKVLALIQAQMSECDKAESAANSETKKLGEKNTRGKAGKNGASGGGPAAETEKNSSVEADNAE